MKIKLSDEEKQLHNVDIQNKIIEIIGSLEIVFPDEDEDEEEVDEEVDEVEEEDSRKFTKKEINQLKRLVNKLYPMNELENCYCYSYYGMTHLCYLFVKFVDLSLFELSELVYSKGIYIDERYIRDYFLSLDGSNLYSDYPSKREYYLLYKGLE